MACRFQDEGRTLSLGGRFPVAELGKFILLTFLSGLLVGCAFQVDSSAPTPYPAGYLPTVIYLTARSIHATAAVQTAAHVTPSATPTFTASPIPPTPTASDTPTTPPGMALGAIQINSPGPMSKIISPLEVHLTVASGKNSKVYIALYGEDGSLLGDELLNIPNASSGEYIFVKIPFEIRAVAEIGILQVTTRNSTGVLMALNTVRVLLLSSGTSQINPPGNTVYERVALETPHYEDTISGGVLTVRGTYSPFNLQTLFLELIDINGKSLNANRQLTLVDLNSLAVNTTIPYKVDSPTQAYLVMRQEDDTLKNPVYLANQQNEVLIGPAYIYTQLITLNP
ncbi:MAG TPA: hypothetical protein VLX61_10125 [Anaerolineales bacterium]|nr:hypothetical protein [Anaerolineales bacterium]